MYEALYNTSNLFTVVLCTKLNSNVLHFQYCYVVYCNTLQYSTLHCTAQCTLHSAQCTLHTAHFPLFTAHCTLHTAHCTLHTAYCTLNTAHCTLHTAYWIFKDPNTFVSYTGLTLKIYSVVQDKCISSRVFFFSFRAIWDCFRKSEAFIRTTWV